MNRRIFFQYFFLGFFIDLNLFSKPSKKPVKVVFKSASKTKKSYPARSINQFFYKDRFINQAYLRENIQNGKIASVKSSLDTQTQTLKSIFTYRDKKALKDCMKIWNSKYSLTADIQHNIISIA